MRIICDVIKGGVETLCVKLTLRAIISNKIRQRERRVLERERERERARDVTFSVFIKRLNFLLKIIINAFLNFMILVNNSFNDRTTRRTTPGMYYA